MYLRIIDPLSQVDIQCHCKEHRRVYICTKRECVLVWLERKDAHINDFGDFFTVTQFKCESCIVAHRHEARDFRDKRSNAYNLSSEVRAVCFVLYRDHRVSAKSLQH